MVLGRLDGERVGLEVAHRFANRPVRLPDGLHWNLLALFTEALAGPARGSSAPLRGVGVDAWGVDYALLDGAGRVLGLPFHYRDARTDGMVARAHSRACPREELYADTGIQTMPINTVFQLLADDGRGARRGRADRARARPARVLAERRARQRGHERLDHRAARRARRAAGRAS